MTTSPDIRDSIRVSDTEREPYITHVTKMAGEGYIEPSEHEARVAAIMKAATLADLARLVKDLPPLAGSKGAQRALVRQQRTAARRERLLHGGWARWRLGVTGIVLVVFLAINLMITIPVAIGRSAPKGPWPLWRDLAMGVSITAGIMLLPLAIILGIFLYDINKERRRTARTGVAK